jgi:hypothetical protein
MLRVLGLGMYAERLGSYRRLVCFLEVLETKGRFGLNDLYSYIVPG